jgi:hypothetical protein
MTKIAGSGFGSISQRHGSGDPDPDPHQNVMDPEHYWKLRPNPKSPRQGDKVDSGIGLPMVNVLESTLECMDIRRGIVNFGIGSHTPCVSLDSFFHVKFKFQHDY